MPPEGRAGRTPKQRGRSRLCILDEEVQEPVRPDVLNLVRFGNSDSCRGLLFEPAMNSPQEHKKP